MVDYSRSAIVVLLEILYFIVKISLDGLQAIIHFFDGTLAHKARIENGTEESGLVASVSYVLARHPCQNMALANDNHFMQWHTEFVTLDYLLKPNITLYLIDSTRVLFVETLPDVNIYDTRKFPFFFLAQKNNCVRTIEIPIDELVKLGKQIGDPRCEVGWVMHTARCGSTLVAQGINAVPNCTVISETQEMMVHLAHVATNPTININEYLNSPEFSNILAAAVIFLLKDFQSGQHICVKATGSLAYPLLPFIAKRFPSHQFISMHRNGVETAKSFWRMGNDYTNLRAALYVKRKLPRLRMKQLLMLPFIFSNSLQAELEEYFQSSLNLFVLFYIQWVTNIVTFQRNVKRLPPGKLLPICHYDLKTGKRATLLQIFHHFNIPLEHIETSLQAMDADSQLGSPLSRDALGSKKLGTEMKTLYKFVKSC